MATKEHKRHLLPGPLLPRRVPVSASGLVAWGIDNAHPRARQRLGVRLSSAALAGANPRRISKPSEKPKRQRTAALQDAGARSDAAEDFGLLFIFDVRHWSLPCASTFVIPPSSFPSSLRRQHIKILDDHLRIARRANDLHHRTGGHFGGDLVIGAQSEIRSAGDDRVLGGL